MSLWRFSRSSGRPRSDSVPALSEQDWNDDGPNPPRYSDLSVLPRSQATSLTSPDTARTHAGDADYARLSALSLVSQRSTPSYATYGNDPNAFSSSTMTLAIPPRYSSCSWNSQAPTEGAGSAPSPGYTFDICSGFKSERWATLRLYDAGHPASQGSRKGKHPRFSNLDTVLGGVELHLSSPQTIRNIELTLKGSIITGGTGEGGSTAFLEQAYTLWDRKFGDPRLLGHDQVQASSKYDGKLSGNWLFPFSIPFPAHVDLSTLHAIYPGTSNGPVRFLPELLDDGAQLTPFVTGGGSTGIQADVQSALPAHPSSIVPFDVRTPSLPTEKGRPVLADLDVPTPEPVPQFSGIVDPSTPAAPSVPSLEPYALHPLAPSDPPSSPHNYDSKIAPSSPLLNTASATRNHRRSGGITLQDSEPPMSTTAYPLPQSFLERDIGANVRYDLILSITHGRTFATKSRVSTAVVYTPITAPPSMAPGRQAAYRNREVPPGPALDPEGWKSLHPVSIRGTFSDQKVLSVSYELSLATPLSYARGTVIPCCLTVACDDISALNLFANPRTLHVRLRRSTRFLQNQVEVDYNQEIPPHTWASSMLGGASAAPKLRLSGTPLGLARTEWDGNDHRSSRHVRQGSTTDITPFLPTVPDEEEEGIETSGHADKCNMQEVCRAVWCTPPHFTQEPHARTLYGEIHLPRALQPNCKFPLLRILYHVDLLAPVTNAFVPDTRYENDAQVTSSQEGEKAEHIFATHAVEITTNTRKGEPTPIAFVKGLAERVRR